VSDYPKVGFGGTCMIVYREDDKFVTYWYDENLPWCERERERERESF